MFESKGYLLKIAYNWITFKIPLDKSFSFMLVHYGFSPFFSEKELALEERF